jgi:hypothetical protein
MSTRVVVGVIAATISSRVGSTWFHHTKRPTAGYSRPSAVPRDPLSWHKAKLQQLRAMRDHQRVASLYGVLKELGAAL